MDPQTPSLSAPASPSAVTLHDTTIDTAEGNEFSNTTRNRPLQITGTLVLQRSLTSPDGDSTPIPAPNSLALPRELVERIILLLDPKSILKCRLVDREFNAIIQSSTLVQYFLACKAAGVIDNPQSPLSYAERLEELTKREDAWIKLEPVFETTIKVDEQMLPAYELTAGFVFLWNETQEDLYYCHLPSYTQDTSQWKRIPRHGPTQSWSGFIIETGMAIYEHDLVVNVISSEVGNQADMRRHSIDLVLLKFSTREYHPLARHSLIHVQRSSQAEPHADVKIVGDNLALVIHDEDGSKLFIFDWKTGHKRLQHKATENAYQRSVPVFLSQELLLVPNRFLSHFEVWHLFPSHPNHNPPVQILFLKIPAVSDNYLIFDISCHGELSPFLDSMPYFPPRPFFPSSEDSIIIVNIRLGSLTGLGNAYRLIVHRRALLDMIQKWTSPSFFEQQDLPIWLTNEVTVHEVTDPNDGPVRIGAQSELVFTTLHPASPRTRDESPILTDFQISPDSPTSDISADSSSSSISSGSVSSTSRYCTLQVQWADWGPPISRWFQLQGMDIWRTRRCNGQRYAFLDSNPPDKRKSVICVADFNPHNVRRNAKMAAQLRGSEDDGGNDDNMEGKKGENQEQLEILDHEGVFSEEVYMGLKCVVYHAPGEYDFDGVLMDGERLLGLKVDGEGRYESIQVLYIG